MVKTKARLVVGLGLLATLLSGRGDAGRAHATSPVPALPYVPRCHTSQVAINAVDGDAGVGHVGILFRVRNRSARFCGMYGYPGAQLLDARYRALPTSVARGPGYLSGNPRPQLVRLVAGASAYFVLEWVHVPSPGQTCPLASYMRVTPPDERTSIVVATRADACGGRLTATPIEPTRVNF